jgi:Ca2+-binding EF-hand superfamily protein
MSAVQVRGEVELAWEERLARSGEQYQQQQQPVGERWIDLPMVLSILAKRGYGKRSVSEEVRMYFRLFDRDNKGFVTLNDLTRVQAEIESTQTELREEMGDLDVLRFKSVGDATLKMMIDVFDVNKDGVVDLEEFCRVVEPILS